MKAAERYTEITAGFIKSLEEGLANPEGWTLPWNIHAGLPINASTGKTYKGGNVLSFWSAAVVNSYDSPYWATYKQWTALGAQVRKGEKATYGVKWVFPDEKAIAKARAAGRRPGAFPAAFAVFNVAQVDGWTPPEAPQALSETERNAQADAFFKAVGADVRVGGDSAHYAPAGDYIAIPTFAAFKDAGGYYATLAHEHTHWTGAESRCARDIIKAAQSRGGTDYAKEELVAELGAAFLCAELGLSVEPRPDHAQYLASWLRILKSDVEGKGDLLWKAATAAQKAVTYLLVASGREEAAPAASSDTDTDEKVLVAS